MSATEFPTNLPHYDSPLIGRDLEAQDILVRLRQPDLRWLTLVGSSGAGKTRLSLQVAALLAADFPAGRTFVSLAPVNDVDLVLATIAQTLGVRQSLGQSLLEGLVAALKTAPVLLILDNVEQVRAAAAQFELLLAQTEQLKLLVTSQVPLEGAHETIFNVPPLLLPQPGQRLAPAQLLGFPSIALFVERMQAIQPSFTLEAQNAAAVVEICTRVQGLPLAIELVAAHSNQMAPKDLLFLLRNYLPLPKTPGTDLSREQILRPLLDWCSKTLAPAVLQLFLGLSVFGGGWSLAAASEICGDGPDRSAVADNLAVLLEKHLILHEVFPDQVAHYVMLDAINDYTRQRMAQLPEAIPIKRRHAMYYLNLITSAEQVPDRSEKLRLEREYHNVRTALRWLVDHDQPDQAAQLAGAMGFFWYHWGYWSEGQRWLEQIRPLMATAPAADQALVLKWLGVLFWMQANATAAMATLQSSLELFQQVGDLVGTSAVLNNLGVMAKDQGHYAEAQGYLGASLQIAHQLGQPGRIITTLNNIGTIAELQADYATALRTYTECLQRAESDGQTASLALSRSNLGRVYFLTGDSATAQPLLEQALALYQELENLHFAATVQNSLALVMLDRHNLAAAEQYARESLQTTRTINDRGRFPYLVESWAALRLAQGHAEQAATLLGVADTLRAELEIPRSLDDQRTLERIMSQLRQQLGAAELDSAQAAGARLDSAAVIAELLGS